MPSTLLDNKGWKVVTSSNLRSLWSLVLRDTASSNWLVMNKATGETWRLSFQEQQFLNSIGERLNAYQFSSEFQNKPGAEQEKLCQDFLSDFLDALALSRRGDDSMLTSLSGKNQADMEAYFSNLWKKR